MVTPTTPAAFISPVSRSLTAPDSDGVADFFATMLESSFDPDPISLLGVDERGVSIVRGALFHAGEQPLCLRRPVNRNQFLAACLDFTIDESVEHLIVGLGLRYGSTTKVSSILRVVGTANQVDFTPMVSAVIDAHYCSAPKSEVLLFHNHPPSWPNQLMDNCPMASPADRRLMATYVFTPYHLARSARGGGRIRFYIGENEWVAEFTQPHWLDLLRTLQTKAPL